MILSLDGGRKKSEKVWMKKHFPDNVYTSGLPPLHCLASSDI